MYNAHWPRSHIEAHEQRQCEGKAHAVFHQCHSVLGDYNLSVTEMLYRGHSHLYIMANLTRSAKSARKWRLNDLD
jgi:hypothetical protein